MNNFDLKSQLEKIEPLDGEEVLEPWYIDFKNNVDYSIKNNVINFLVLEEFSDWPSEINELAQLISEYEVETIGLVSPMYNFDMVNALINNGYEIYDYSLLPVKDLGEDLINERVFMFSKRDEWL